MQIDESEEQPENAEFSIRESVEPDSNVTEPKLGFRAKQPLPRVVTDEGMEIAQKDEQS
jgi:hypothetical protein